MVAAVFIVHGPAVVKGKKIWRSYPVNSVVRELLPVEALGMRNRPFVTYLHGRQRGMHSDPVGQPVLDVPDEGVSLGTIVGQLGKLRRIGEPRARDAVLPARDDGLIGRTNGALLARE